MMVETIEKATVLEKVQRAYEQLNTLLAPLSESQSAPVWRYINGELCEHFEEHGNMIRRWLGVEILE